ncbi:MAG: 16S rRNA (adenine(1518)-N(6)/adenine(1519)-N(6))-dimethyltransferase RsmA [Thiotrichaceae bacterium]|nr:16S rRNA (adenine(1518)-N(6)/adenine(1519)-N(6))-dimethyltransferase RsmA [Thiotrichaceae bacterium]
MKKYKTKKRFGQHFLHDNHVISQIVSAIRPKKQDTMIEIGPGLGALTFPLLKHLDHIQLIEIDRDIIQRLTELADNRLTIHAVDALKLDLSTLVDAHSLRIVGNLPYNISTPLIFHLLESGADIADMHFMLQKEVVDRMVAAPNSKTYGRLSVMVQYQCRVDALFNVPRGAFSPPPKVESAVVRLQPWQENSPYTKTNLSCLANIVNQAFMKRRKTLRNAIKELLSQEQIEQAGIDPKLRPENLSVEDFVQLSLVLHQQ